MMNGILERATLENIINLLHMDVETMECNEQNYELMREGQLSDIEKVLHSYLSPENSAAMIENIRDFENIISREYLQIGFKAGVKLMKELDHL